MVTRMNEDPIKIPPATQQAQNQASDPAYSAWVSANAGSGKTYVLAQRVLRLLLGTNQRPGCDPSRIMCLTFTKAAAAEMSNRVFKLLSEWAMMPKDALQDVLTQLTGESADGIIVDRARQLFARALETPGGLKIQTIHAFCEALLHQFPLEANLSGHFDVMDTTAQKGLLAEARRGLLLATQAGGDPALQTALADLFDRAGDQAFEDAMNEIITRRDGLNQWFSLEGDIDRSLTELTQHLGFAETDTPGILASRYFSGPTWALEYFSTILRDAANSSKVTDNKFARMLERSLAANSAEEQIDVWSDCLLTQQLEVRKTIITKELKDIHPTLEDELLAIATSLKQARDKLALLELLEGSRSLFTLANALIARYEALKRVRGLLDFEDLIVRSATLLTRVDARHWVQYKLDRGIDHLLVDEAQDTSPRQWEVITALVEEFFAGKGARDSSRSVFAVGDEKQSIYSFQGAEPTSFSRQRDHFDEKAKGAGENLKKIELHLSFRSTPDVLSAVDKVFENPLNRAGLSSDGEKTVHETVRSADAGMVDIWPMISSSIPEDPEKWSQPVDHMGDQYPAALLAAKIAATVDGWLKNGEMLEGKSRAIRAGDIIVLVRSRDRFAAALTRQLKRRNVAVAGADRLKLTQHIVVEDLLALGRFVLLPQDDLSLAAVLKSPLFEYDEQKLFDLAHQRDERTLFQQLRHKAESDALAKKTLAQLNRIRARADQLPVYEFFASLLFADGGRERFLMRLGREAEEVLDGFLAETLNHERFGISGLQSFIEWLESAAPEIKREVDLQKDELRIMTIHAAKGLEAPIIFLIDKGGKPYNRRHNPALIKLPDKYVDTMNREPAGFLWLPKSNMADSTVSTLLDDIEIKAEEEYRRLLYVAMTRAADRLVVCGYHGSRKPAEDCWHSIISAALIEQSSAIENEDGELLFHRWQQARHGSVKPAMQTKTAEVESTSPLPDWIDAQLEAEPLLPEPLTPSGAQALIGGDDVEQGQPRSGPDSDAIAFGMKRGTIIHRLLQSLPETAPAKRFEVMDAYLLLHLPQVSPSQRQLIADEIENVFNAPMLSAMFSAENSRAEVALTGTVEIAGIPRKVSGQIDRLVVFDERVWIVDYKTNLHIPNSLEAVPKNYLQQMSLYRSLIAKIYPNHKVECYLIWTQGPQIMQLSDETLKKAMTSKVR